MIVWKLDRLGRNLKHLVTTVHELSEKDVGFKVLAGQGANIDTATSSGKLIFGIFAALAEFERELISERTKAALTAARARGRKGGAKFSLTKAQVRLAQSAMGQKETVISELCKELGITKPTLYRYFAPNGALRDYGKRVLGLTNSAVKKYQTALKVILFRKKWDVNNKFATKSRGTLEPFVD